MRDNVLHPFISYGENEVFENFPGGCIHNTLCSLKLKNGPNKLECFITLGWKVLHHIKTLACSAHLQVMKTINCCKYCPMDHIHTLYFLRGTRVGPIS
jgi:hypothetical protein